MLTSTPQYSTPTPPVQGHIAPGANGTPQADDLPTCEVIVWESGVVRSKERTRRMRWPLPADADLSAQMKALGYERDPWLRLGSSDVFDSVALEIYVKREDEPDVEYRYLVALGGAFSTWRWVTCATLADLLNLCNQFKDLIRLSIETEERVMREQERADEERLRRKWGGAA